jgi:lysophospholipase L1-like esterase
MATVYTKTDNYGLNLYGDNDPADLRDGYNGSMRTIDTTLETHLNRIEAVESRETHDEEVAKALLGDNTVDAATTAKTKWNKASTDAIEAMADAIEAMADAATATGKANSNGSILTALGADTTDHATASKTKWDKASTDATSAIGKADTANSKANDNNAILSALGTDSTDQAAAAKTKWDKASADVADVVKRINILTGLTHENIIVIGDSISYGTGASDTSKSWANRLGEYRGATVTNLAKNDAGYLNGPTTFAQQLNGFTGDKDAVTRILIAGGINDKTHVSDGSTTDSLLTNAVLSLLDYARANFPHAKIQTIPTICGFTPPSIYNSGVLKARDRIIAACGMRHVQVIPYGWEWLNGNPGWSSGDDVHPSDEGNGVLLRLICEAMDGAAVRNSWNGYVAGQDAHGEITHSKFHVDGDMVTCHIQGKVVGNAGAYASIFQVPAAARNGGGNYFIPNSLNKLLYLSYDNELRACRIGTTTAISNDTEVYLSFATHMG